jgi:hypothetical protein
MTAFQRQMEGCKPSTSIIYVWQLLLLVDLFEANEMSIYKMFTRLVAGRSFSEELLMMILA